MTGFPISDRALLRIEKAFGVAGLGITVWMVHRLGSARIIGNLHAVGWGFFLLICTAGLHIVFQALAWRLILPEHARSVSFLRLMRIVMEGDALNYITVTKVGGEAVKAYALKGHTTLAESAASVIILKFCMFLGFWAATLAGFLAALFSGADSTFIKGIGSGFLGLTLFIAGLSWLQHKGVSLPLSWILRQFRSKWDWFAHLTMRLARLDESVFRLYRAGRWRLALAAALCALPWLEEIFFIWIMFRFLGVPEGWVLPTLLSTTALLLNTLFFFVPWRAGTQEGTLVLAFTIAGRSEPMGLSIAILRRMRELVWVFLGLVLFSLERAPDAAPPLTPHAPR